MRVLIQMISRRVSYCIDFGCCSWGESHSPCFISAEFILGRINYFRCELNNLLFVVVIFVGML